MTTGRSGQTLRGAPFSAFLEASRLGRPDLCAGRDNRSDRHAAAPQSPARAPRRGGSRRLGGCAGPPGAIRPVAAFLLWLAVTVPAPARAEKCIADDATRVEVLGWLQVHGYLTGPPWTKLFENPPLTGPGAGVDSSLYVEFFRKIAHELAVDQPDSTMPSIPFPSWSTAKQDSFVRENWRSWLFADFPPDSSAPPDTIFPPDPPDTSSALLHAADFEYLGAQRVSGQVAWEGGAALGFYPPNGTLFMSATELTGIVLEVQPASPSMSRTVSALPSTTTVRTLLNATGGRFNVAGDYTRAGDFHPIQIADGTWRVVFSDFDYYDRAYRCRAGFGWFKPDGTGAAGLWHLGAHWPTQEDSDQLTYQGKLTDYVVTLPKAFADQHLGGKRYLVGRVRGEYGEDVSCGPAAYAVDFAGAPDGATLDVLPLISYPTTGFVGENTVPPRALPGYSLTDQYTDAFVIDGTLGFGGHECEFASHYFHDDGSGGINDDAGVCDENKGYACGSESNTGPGYRAYFLLYRLDDLARVARGELQPWEVRPYEKVLVSDKFLDASCRASIGGIAEDEVGRILWVCEVTADQDDKPILHAWRVRE